MIHIPLHIRKWVSPDYQVHCPHWIVRCESTLKWFTPSYPYTKPSVCPHCLTSLTVSQTVSWYDRDLEVE